MLLVNFLGGYDAVPALLHHHHTWCSYADTIMPQFFFAVGMALRLVVQRDSLRQNRAAALWRGCQRGLLLVLIGCFWYHPSRDFDTWADLTGTPAGPLLRDLFLTNVFLALTHIGVVTGSIRSSAGAESKVPWWQNSRSGAPCFLIYSARCSLTLR